MNPIDGRKTEPAKIEEAYTELTQEAFAIWIRLMVAPDHVLEGGRKHLAPLLGYSMGRCNEILRELKRKGYIRLIKSDNIGEPTLIEIIRPAMISGRNRFIRLANALMTVAAEIDDLSKSGASCPAPNYQHQTVENQPKDTFVWSSDTGRDVDSETAKTLSERANELYGTETRGTIASVLQQLAISECAESSGLHTHQMPSKNTTSLPVSHASHAVQGFGGGGVKVDVVEAKDELEVKQFGGESYSHALVESASICPMKRERLPPPDLELLDELRGLKTVHERQDNSLEKEKKEPGESIDKLDHKRESVHERGNRLRSSLDISKIRSLKQAKKEEEEQTRERQRARAKAQGKRPVKLDWAKIDLRGQPAISWDMDDEEREKINAILAKSDRDYGKRQLVNKLASEFRRYYTNYRRGIQEAKGNKRSYQFIDSEMRYARQAAILCIAKSVTPRQLLEYWHVNVGNFADGKMKVPPLAFLAAPANIDTVACALVGEYKGHKWRPGDFTKEHSSHSFSDISQLDKRLRPALERAGFEMREFNDRHLLTIQSTAKSRLKRSGLFVSAQLKPMVEIAEILFTKGFDAVPKCKPRPKPEEPKKRARFDLEDFDDVELDEEDYSDED